MELGEDERHPILRCAWAYDIVHMDWHLLGDAPGKSHLDLTFVNGGEIRRLRFLSPRDLKIDEGFCGVCSGLEILDISRRQWDNTKVEVINFEQHPGITFIAADVVDLDREEAAT
jgi:hypothetical protein